MAAACARSKDRDQHQVAGGFNFDLCQRNHILDKLGAKSPTTKKTGTTICGIIFKDGVCLGADTRATEGPIVCDKNCEKIHYIADTIYCCGAGTSADTENVTGLVSSQLELHRLNTDKAPRVVTAVTMLKGYVSAALVLGGVDCSGSHLYTVYPHGSSDKLPYVTMGSGSLAAMAIFEAEYKEDMEREDAIKLVQKAIRAGIFNDLGSGSNVDICIITKDGKEMLRNYDKANPRLPLSREYKFAKGTTVVLNEKVEKLESLVYVEEGEAPVSMDTQ